MRAESPPSGTRQIRLGAVLARAEGVGGAIRLPWGNSETGIIGQESVRQVGESRATTSPPSTSPVSTNPRLVYRAFATVLSGS